MAQVDDRYDISGMSYNIISWQWQDTCKLIIKLSP